MPGLALREFECSLCLARFTMFAGDLLLPGPNLCDDCLTAVWQLENDALTNHVLERAGVQSQDKTWVNSIIQHIKWNREQWTTVEDVVRYRR